MTQCEGSMERTWLQGGKTTNHQTLFPREPTTGLPKRRKWKTGIDIKLDHYSKIPMSSFCACLLCPVWFCMSLSFHALTEPHRCVSRTKKLNFFPACSAMCEQNKKTCFFSLHVLQSHSKFKPTASQERSKSSTNVHIVTNSLFYLGLTSLSQFPIRIKYCLEFLDK